MALLTTSPGRHYPVLARGHSADAVEWCNTQGDQIYDWGYYDGRYYFKDKNNALMFLLKFTSQTGFAV